MKKLLKSVWLVLALALTAVAADNITLIHLDVDAAGKIMVDGKATPNASVTTTVAGLIRDRDHTAVELKYPEKLDKAVLEQIKEACRKAGIARFALVVKPS